MTFSVSFFDRSFRSVCSDFILQISPSRLIRSWRRLIASCSKLTFSCLIFSSWPLSWPKGLSLIASSASSSVDTEASIPRCFGLLGTRDWQCRGWGTVKVVWKDVDRGGLRVNFEGSDFVLRIGLISSLDSSALTLPTQVLFIFATFECFKPSPKSSRGLFFCWWDIESPNGCQSVSAAWSSFKICF